VSAAVQILLPQIESAGSARPIYGVMAEFEAPQTLLEATRRAYQEGYRKMDAYTPFPVEDLPEALGHHWTAIPLITLLGGIIGGLGAYFMQWYAMAILYPLNIGERPLNSWPMFIPITFELTVLIASISAVLGMLVLNRLPEPHHPVFNAPGFERASSDRFFLCIEAADPKFDLEEARSFLQQTQPLRVTEVMA
jgi:hypothetical protein